MINWDDMNKGERAALVREYLTEKGWSYSQLASYLNVTRNTIAGICNRNGIKIGSRQKVVILPSEVPPVRPSNVVPFPVEPASDREEAVSDMVKKAAAKLKAKRKLSTQTQAHRSLVHRELDLESVYARDPRPLREEFWQPLPGSTPVAIAETESWHCRWPVSPDNHQCCGNPAKEGKPYCEHHCAIAYRPAPPIKWKKRRGEKTLAA